MHSLVHMSKTLGVPAQLTELTCVPCLFLSFQAPAQALAQNVLAELPQQVASFFNLFKLKPPNDPSPS